MKTLLTDRFLRALKPAAPGKRDVFWDSAVPCFNVRVTDTGNVSANVMDRIRGRALPIRVPIGFPWHCPLPPGVPVPVALSALREDARAVKLDMSRGIDPRAKREAARLAEEQSERLTFAAVANDFLNEHVAGLRSATGVNRVFKSAILPILGRLPIAAVTDQDIARLIKSIARRGCVPRARNTFALVRKMFGWAIAQRAYGLTTSPCAGLAINDIAGKVSPRQRTLTNSELPALWAALAGFSYPAAAGPFIRMLLLTGQRLREVSEMTWQEVDLDKAVWAISGKRMKTGSPHIVPLAPMACGILQEIPRGAGPFVFSTCDGRKPIAGFSKLKERVDAAIGPIEPWRFHDLRRTMRTGLSALGVADIVSELVIAHSQKGLHAVYDQHGYLAEKRNALERWGRHLLSVVEPAPANILEFVGGRHGR